MSSEKMATLSEMIDSLPEAAQRQVVDHLREYIEDLRDEEKWDAAFERSQSELVEAARRARREIAER